MPVQVRRLLVAFTIFIGLMLILKYYLTPDSWGEYGFYRGKALEEISSKEAKYVELETCEMCHDTIAATKAESVHVSLQCETCHGPGYKHAEDPENVKIDLPGVKNFCLRCHQKNTAKSESVIVQINAEEHYPEEKCINCHNPHQPNYDK